MQLNKKKVEKKSTRYGDTIVEAVIAIAVYSIVAVLALGAMNSGLKSAQKNLESSMARAALDTQADTLRYIYENYLIARKSSDQDAALYKAIWENFITDTGTIGRMNNASSENKDQEVKNFVHSLDDSDVHDCGDMISKDSRIFALNSRMLYSRSLISDSDMANKGFKSGSTTIGRGSEAKEAIIYNTNIRAASLYPRIVYHSRESKGGSEEEQNLNAFNSILLGGSVLDNTTNSPSRLASRAEGVWIVAIDKERSSTEGLADTYDFYVRACWNAAGEKAPTSLTTVVRLYKAKQ